jgi:predicted P-loop ATPase
MADQTNQAAPAWLPGVESIARALEEASEAKRKEAVDVLKQQNSEAAAKLNELFAAQDVKKISPPLQPAAPEPEPAQSSSVELDGFDPDTPRWFIQRMKEKKAQTATQPQPQPKPESKPDSDSVPQTAADVLEFAKLKAKPKSKHIDQSPECGIQAPEKSPGTSLALARPQAPVAFQHSKSPTGIAQSLENALIAVDKLEIDCRYDIFHDRIVVSERQLGLRGDALNNLENVALKVRQEVLRKFGFDPGSNFTFDALRIICLDRVFDPVRDYLDSLEWDGVPRLDTWLIKYCGADPTALNKAIGRKMLTAAVRRVRVPGCKFDYITVLESEHQGIGKSTMLRELAGDENFSDAEIIGLDKREQQESIQGVWIYEIAELEGLYKSEVTSMKLFASKQVDAARPAYGRSRVDRPRRCIMVATTNEKTYLRDPTGNRRYWPVLLHGVIDKPDAGIRMIDLAGIKRDRDQLWAEAAAIETTGEPLVIPEKLWPAAKLQQQSRMEPDAWLDILAAHLAARTIKGKTIEGQFAVASDSDGNGQYRAATEYLLANVLSIPVERQNNNHTKRLAAVMRELGWTLKADPMRIGKSSLKRGYIKPIEAP